MGARTQKTKARLFINTPGPGVARLCALEMNPLSNFSHIYIPIVHLRFTPLLACLGTTSLNKNSTSRKSIATLSHSLSLIGPIGPLGTLLCTHLSNTGATTRGRGELELRPTESGKLFF